MNKVILVGRLTKDPEVRYTQGENPMAIARYTLAVDRRFKRDGEPTADFINCVVFGKSAEFAEKTLDRDLECLFRDVSPLVATRIKMVSKFIQRK